MGSADENEVEIASSGHVHAGRIVGSPLFIVSVLLGLREIVKSHEVRTLANHDLCKVSALEARTASQLCTRLPTRMRHVSLPTPGFQLPAPKRHENSVIV